MQRRRFLEGSGAAVAALAMGVSSPYVSRAAAGPVRLFVPGTGRSALAGRILAGALQHELGRHVETVGVDAPREGYLRLAGAPADGSTIGLVGADVPALNRGLGGSPPVGAFAPIALMSEDPAGIHVRRDAPWRSVGDLTAALRSSGAAPRASGAGRLAVWHLSAERWRLAARGAPVLPWTAAPSPAEAAEALVAGGGPDIVVCSVPEVRGTAAGPGIRTLAVMSMRRNPRYPELATLGESGLRVRAGWWRGVAAPPGTSARDIATVEQALRRVHASSAWRSEMTRRGFALAWAGPRQFAQFMASEDSAMASAIRAAG